MIIILFLIQIALSYSGIYEIEITEFSRCKSKFRFLKGSGLNGDLNEWAKGKFIYLCYRNEKNYESEQEITDLELFSHVKMCKKTDKANEWNHIIWKDSLNGDLNQGSGGEYIYLCYKKEENNKKIIEDMHLSSNGCQDGYTQVKSQEAKLNGDLNQGTPGKFMNLCVKKRDDQPNHLNELKKDKENIIESNYLNQSIEKIYKIQENIIKELNGIKENAANDEFHQMKGDSANKFIEIEKTVNELNQMRKNFTHKFIQIEEAVHELNQMKNNFTDKFIEIEDKLNQIEKNINRSNTISEHISVAEVDQIKKNIIELNQTIHWIYGIFIALLVIIISPFVIFICSAFGKKTSSVAKIS